MLHGLLLIWKLLYMYMYYVKYIIAAILAKYFYFQPKEEIVKMSENALCWKTVVKLYIAYS